MKTVFAIGMTVLAISTSAFAGNGQIGSVGSSSTMVFTNGGTAHPTTAADGVYLKGTQAAILYDSLNVTESSVASNGAVKQKIVHLDGQMPSTQNYLGCYRDVNSNETECYLGKIK